MELKKSFRPEYAALAIIFGAILYLAGSTWLKCGDMIIDTFRDPLISLKVMSGQTLYKDMFYEYGFFAPHCLALVFRLFGVSTVTLAVFGLSVTVLMSLVLYAIARHFLDITASLLVVLTFLFAFAFGFYSYNGIFNFVMPYSHSSVFFSLFSAFSVLCFIRFVFTDKTRYLALWAVSMLLTFLCRIDAPIMVWGAFFIIFLLKARKENGFRFSLKDLWVFVPLVGAFIFYFVYLRSTGALDPFLRSTIGLIWGTKANNFIIEGLGVKNIGLSFFLIGSSLFWHITALFLIGVGVYGFARYSSDREDDHLLLFLSTVLIVVVFFIKSNFMAGVNQFRIAPILFIFGAGYYFRKYLVSCSKQHIGLFTLNIVAFVMSVKVFFNATPHFYGFYLLPLGLICYYLFFLDILKKEVFLKLKGLPVIPYLSVLQCFFLVLALGYWGSSLRGYEGKSMKMLTDRGTYVTWNDIISSRVWEAVAYLKFETPKDATVVVIPEAEGINFFSERVNPLRYPVVFPTNLSITPEHEIIDDFRTVNADYIVIVQRPTIEYGPTSFGVDYALELDGWIKEHYSLVQKIGPLPFTTKEFGIAIYKSNQLF